MVVSGVQLCRFVQKVKICGSFSGIFRFVDDAFESLAEQLLQSRLDDVRAKDARVVLLEEVGANDNKVCQLNRGYSPIAF